MALALYQPVISLTKNHSQEPRASSVTDEQEVGRATLRCLTGEIESETKEKQQREEQSNEDAS